MVHSSEMIHGDDMVQETKMVHGDEVIQGSGLVNDETINGDEMIHGSEMIHGNHIIQVNNEMVQVNGMANGDEMAHGNELVSADVSPPNSRRRKKKSPVWEHFTIEPVPGDIQCQRACCNLCKGTFAYSTGAKIAGTSHLKRHITHGSCPVIKSQDKKVALSSAGVTDNDCEGTIGRPSKRRYRYTGFANATFDQDRSSFYVAKLIILHDYRLDIVQQPAFTAFIESLQPRFRVADVETMEGEIYAVYEKEKDNLLQTFSTLPGRMSLTIGLWTTSQTLGYVSLAAQFIDTEWKVHRRMLNFTMVPSPHPQNAVTDAISRCLPDWGMKDKLFTITLENDCSSHDIYSANLRDHLSSKNDVMLKGQLFVVRCYARILNAAAQDVIASIHGVIYTKYVKVVNDSVHELYKEYVAQPLPLTPAYVEQPAANGNKTQAAPPSTGDGLVDFDMYLSEIATVQPSKSELEQYLDESLTPRTQEFDILDWWKLNTLRFPTLSKMARDVLAIPVSTVTAGSSIFSAGTGSRMLDEYRSSLRPEIVEALVCAKDWLPHSPTASPSCALVNLQ
ncbi:hypothetical protein ACQ4PT_037807 [Festuca glaucescens]